MSSDRPPCIRLMRSPVMDRWLFVIGRTLEDARLFTLGDGYGSPGPSFFESRREAKDAAATCGLGILDNGVIYADGPDEFIDEAIGEGQVDIGPLSTRIWRGGR